MLTLCWSDGNSLIPVNSCLLASSKESNIIGPKRSFDKRTIAGKRRELAQTKAPKAMLTLLDNATKAGLSADYVLFDSWFATPAQITDIKYPVLYLILNQGCQNICKMHYILNLKQHKSLFC